METITLKELNNLFSNLRNLRNNGKRIERQTIKDLSTTYDGSQGDTSVFHEIYPYADGILIKLTINTDSYGSNEFVAGIEFVKEITKKVTAYESI